MTQYTKPDDLPVWAESGDKVQPTDLEIQAGWPVTTIPPSRQRFNWILGWLAQGVRYFMQRGIPDWDATEDYPLYAKVVRDGITYSAILGSGNINQDPTTATTYWVIWADTRTAADARYARLSGATFTGSISATNFSGSSSGTNTGDEPAASTTVAGSVELATNAEVNTGTDTSRAVTPAGIAAYYAKLVGGVVQASQLPIGTSIPALNTSAFNGNCDTLTTPGLYSIASTATNWPFNNNGMMQVLDNGIGSYGQFAFRIPSTNNPEIAFREKGTTSGVWSDWETVPFVSKLQTQDYTRATTAGTADAFTLTLSPAPTAYANLSGVLRFDQLPNAGATININGLGAKQLRVEKPSRQGTISYRYQINPYDVSTVRDYRWHYDGTYILIDDPIQYSKGRLIGETVASGTPTYVDFFDNQLDNYTEIELEVTDAAPQAGGYALGVRISTDGSTFDATSPHYITDGTTSSLFTCGGMTVEADAEAMENGSVIFMTPGGSNGKTMRYELVKSTGATPPLGAAANGWGIYSNGNGSSAYTIQGIRAFYSGTAIRNGSTFRLWGR